VFFKRDVVLAQEYLAFTLLNLFDLFLSGYIFKYGGIEANGLAAWIYGRFGGLGFAVYKFLLVLILVLACEGIAVRSVRKARLVVTFGCLVYLLLVLYESTQIFVHITGPHGSRPA
jgi:hypothetical protein